jgi:DNA-binding response OmpR family regulator
MERPILVIENDTETAQGIACHLGAQGHVVVLETVSERGMLQAADQRFDLVILSRRLQGADALEFCRRLRAAGNGVPVFILAERASEIDRVLGLGMGAVDYLPKPLSIPELGARVRALFRRLEMAFIEPAADLIRADGMSIDPGCHEVTVEGRPVNLTAKGFDLLTFLASHPGRVFSRGQLLAQVWGYDYDGYEYAVNSHINRLRSKIEADSAKPQHILTVWRVGYKFRDKPPLASSRGQSPVTEM